MTLQMSRRHRPPALQRRAPARAIATKCGDLRPSGISWRPRADAFPYREWVATLANRTNVVVSDWCAAPSPLGIEKAVSIVQSRAYLENRARLLLLPFGKETASWRLATIDFASAARRHRCEFRMCFAVQDTSGVLSMTSPSVEIGFALPAPGATDPVFVLTVVTVVGFAA